MRKRYLSKKAFIFRARIVLTFFLVIFFLLLWRFYDLQIIKHDYYLSKAERQYSYSSQYYDRGSIYFQNKDKTLFSVADIKTSHTLAIVPKLMKKSELDSIYNFLNKDAGLKISKKTFYRKAALKDDPYEELVRGVDDKTAEIILSKKFKGVILPKYRFRFYPANSMASQLIGFVAQNAHDNGMHGRYGLEKYYDKELFKDPQKLGINFFAELFGDIKKIANGDFSDNGSLVTSIEPSVQMQLEKVLERTYKKWHSKRVSAIVYDPNSGEIVAMGSYPNFDLNHFSKVESTEIYENPLVENVYEMGSIVKAITVASGLDSGVIRENETYYDSGCKVYDSSRICNYDKRARHTVPVQEILSQSLNVGAAWVYEQMGKKRFKSYFDKLGLTDISGVDLPNEAEPLVGNLNSPRDIEFATASFGQGVAFSPIAMVRALGALGTGYIRIPHIVKYIKKDSGIMVNLAPKDDAERVYKDSTVESISRMLVEVVDKKLANGKRKKEHYTVAAKTGTAEISRMGAYEKGIYNHTFFGYFPAFKPRFVLLFVNERPHGAKYASQTLTDPFYEMVDFLINYYNIEPDR